MQMLALFFLFSFLPQGMSWQRCIHASPRERLHFVQGVKKPLMFQFPRILLPDSPLYPLSLAKFQLFGLNPSLLFPGLYLNKIKTHSGHIYYKHVLGTWCPKNSLWAVLRHMAQLCLMATQVRVPA